MRHIWWRDSSKERSFHAEFMIYFFHMHDHNFTRAFVFFIQSRAESQTNHASDLVVIFVCLPVRLDFHYWMIHTHGWHDMRGTYSWEKLTRSTIPEVRLFRCSHIFVRSRWQRNCSRRADWSRRLALTGEVQSMVWCSTSTGTSVAWSVWADVGNYLERVEHWFSTFEHTRCTRESALTFLRRLTNEMDQRVKIFQ